MKIFDDEKLDNLFLEKSEEMKRQLSPIIDSLILVDMKLNILPMEQYINPERRKEASALKAYYVELIHQIIGYNPQEDEKK